MTKIETKIKDLKGVSCPPGKTHYLRYATDKGTVTTQCNRVFLPGWEYTDDEVNCPNCLLATIKRKETIRKPLKNTTQDVLFYISLLVIVVFTCCGITCLFKIL